jgi:hypothetical protein
MQRQSLLETGIGGKGADVALLALAGDGQPQT